VDEIITRVARGTGYLTLERPQALNALSSAMIDYVTETLSGWADDDQVDQVVLTGRGRGFCAGADVRELRQIVLDQRADPVDFLRREYALDQLVAGYPKPVTAWMSGIVMGGGLGLSVHAGHRVVDATTALAMPETIIGLWPDVGVAYDLARLPGQLGTWMALTGLPINGPHGLAVGLADAMTGRGPAVPEMAWLAEAFAGEDAAAIVQRLGASAEPGAQAALAAIRQRSPLSVCVSLAAIRRAERLTLAEVFAQDLVIGAHLVTGPDFVEGVRAQLVDKDHQPHWSYARIEDVPPAAVAAAFA